MRHTPPDSTLLRLIGEFKEIRHDLLRLVDDSADLLQDIHPHHQLSARNLLHYLALRSHDLRGLQAQLSAAGLSSLGRAESHVLTAVETVLDILERLCDVQQEVVSGALEPIDFATGQRLLKAHTEAVLGPAPARGVAIMVTMPSEAADDYTLVSDLLQQGMNCMRINCAHDGPAEWARMAAHLRRAGERLGKSCRILMDLAGPKVRTGELQPGPAVLKFRPRRDSRGRVLEPARVWLFAEDQRRPSPTPADASLPVPGAWLQKLAARRSHRVCRCARRVACPSRRRDRCRRVLGRIEQDVLRGGRHAASARACRRWTTDDESAS